ncbi:phosphoribosylformylglycinamidine cyclo-ligase [Brachyspira aalborgi]|jgi:phosphoribosylformylglycinamidine cyclo-ligase|uniref:Phosphoribosylformylglycinamidine cyclo-ligase n=1 Tax=Brachyspira aalborgi TaxID=29522 RepID=A0AB38PYD1_9SPIR|nr:phosphoribosylformylglycinamidine cyclo-ligase [Brachyspira aalborgi]MBS4762638.1 phosphoribosylformylglycinamidine cyclo-ligase [Brachyspira sp.]CCY78213.1 phosphoribosylformylglycinamidine cyclo-ligase [Brachyspira sp. CAG:700]TXJ15058.1 phosphoribosylformylglycinamidine cyclo-ligase [Brachyspira aalborgi]TXJ18306.1 phosphoribosylformylglycinamidine cyclo-ligase [Brachyspira aalborgi]TXJ24264.1 phosphoribosylformylglycinamidine cyclo-ligase [Brachyspira aalborgi]
MNNSKSDIYAKAGVDITAGYKSVELIKKHIAKTNIKGVISSIGGFGGLFELDLIGIKKPVLVSGTDGVGTKLKIAFLMNKHDTIGIDCVAMCVNDIICVGAKPLIFLDYIACGKNYPEKISEIVKGISKGCVQSNCALIGGETAEMPDFYSKDEYDLAGYSTGIVDKSKIINNSLIKKGDIIIALSSSGIHSNGFSLVRKILNINNSNINNVVKELGKKSIGEILLTPTKIYVKPILKLLKKIKVKGISHITGGGFYENIPRCIPNGLCAEIEKNKIKILPIFKYIQKIGNIEERDMFNTFNMGVGMCIIVSKKDAEKTIEILSSCKEDAYIIGKIIENKEKIIFKE